MRLGGNEYTTPPAMAMTLCVYCRHSPKRLTNSHSRRSLVWKMWPPWACISCPPRISVCAMPATWGRRSSTSTRRPRSASARAQVAPNNPAPTIRKSNTSLVSSDSRVSPHDDLFQLGHGQRQFAAGRAALSKRVCQRLRLAANLLVAPRLISLGRVIGKGFLDLVDGPLVG